MGKLLLNRRASRLIRSRSNRQDDRVAGSRGEELGLDPVDLGQRRWCHHRTEWAFGMDAAAMQ